MNAFKSEYQKAVVANAKAFAKALKEQGLTVEGDPGIGYTETHQVIVRVGYGKGPEMAERLERNNVIVTIRARRTTKDSPLPVVSGWAFRR